MGIKRTGGIGAWKYRGRKKTQRKGVGNSDRKSRERERGRLRLRDSGGNRE